MRLVYYIAAHHKPYQFRWLFESLREPDDVILIQVDRKAPAEVYEAIHKAANGRPNTHFLPRRNVLWGGWSQVTSELTAMRYALALGSDWHYFINLSGQDYPIQSDDAIRKALTDAWPRNFIRVWTFDRVRELEPQDPHLLQRCEMEAFGRIISLPFAAMGPKDLDVEFKGSQWHILSREFCEWVVSSPIARRLSTHFQFTRVPDETFFQAAIMNSPYRDQRMPDAGRLFFFPGPKVIDNADLNRVLGASEFFARKFDAAVDHSVLEILASTHGYRVPAE